ncbi:flagellar hook-associated protein FlgK [Shouchella shacheensis]|uniref:flagellar hook-associated protein FlgK n=1 Tax=Shouchella shacheensis TaxID=1649580 RepID=UPI00073FD7E4|nr:flagellar hook-associated protein FlgK [Shouchella shacheensis]
MSTFFGLETMRRAVGTNRAALQTVGHNIANAGTPGYSRQRVNLQATGGFPSAGTQQTTINGRLGTGVELGSVQRVRDQFLDKQFRTESKNEGFYYMQTQALERLEDIFNEAPSNDGGMPTGTLSSQLSAFWNSWAELGAGQENRAVLREQAKSVSDTFAHLHTSITEEKEGLEREAATQMKQVNTLLEQIAQNNQRIAQAEASGHLPNDLYDAQDQLVDQLSGMMDITVERQTLSGQAKGNAEGVYEIALKQSNQSEQDLTLVYASGEEPRQLSLSKDDANGGFSWSFEGGEPVDLGRGELAGLAESHKVFEEALQKVDEIAGAFVQEVNEIHRLGFTKDGVQAGDFFVIDGDVAATSINVHERIESDLAQIGASSGEIAGDVTNAQRMAELRDHATIGGAYRDYMEELGVRTASSRQNLEASTMRIANIETNRMSVSSVSLDEELTMLVQYQHSYNAAARALTAMDEMLDRIINGMGVVGR